jgi:hypothetical protein
MTPSGHPDTTSGQPRIPGVRYRKTRRHRTETTTIGGISETREVPYEVYEPIPPRDPDDIILRGVTGVAVGVTALSVAGTTASVGGLLGHLIPAPVAYGVALVFDSVWLACLGVEWLERLDPQRAWPARIAGWAALLIGMGAIAAYGTTLGQPVAGVAGAAVGLLAKGLWWLVLRHYAVPLSEGVAHWLRRRREKTAARTLLSSQLRRLDKREAYMQAAYGPAAVTAAEVVEIEDPQPVQAVAAPPAPAQGWEAAPAVPAAQHAPAPIPTNTATPSTQITPPAPSINTAPASAGAPGSAAGGAPNPNTVSPIGQSIAATIRAALVDTSGITDEDLLDHVRSVHGDRPRLADTVTRTRRRIERRAS